MRWGNWDTGGYSIPGGLWHIRRNITRYFRCSRGTPPGTRGTRRAGTCTHRMHFGRSSVSLSFRRRVYKCICRCYTYVVHGSRHEFVRLRVRASADVWACGCVCTCACLCMRTFVWRTCGTCCISIGNLKAKHFRACVRSACVRVRVRVRVCVCVSVCVLNARVCAPALCGPSRHTAGTCGIYSSARDVRAATCAFCVSVIGRWRCGAAGVTWTNRTTSAPWAARADHATVIDAAGAIYVIGGNDGSHNFYKDVWVSTDGGADRKRAGLSGGVLGGTYCVDSTGYSTGVIRVCVQGVSLSLCLY